MIEYITDDVVSFIMEDFKVPIIEAIWRLYTSETLGNLNKSETEKMQVVSTFIFGLVYFKNLRILQINYL